MTTQPSVPANHEHGHDEKHSIHLPEPTPWPFVLALGIMLIVGSPVLDIGVGLLGLLLTVMGVVGWFKDVLPHERVVHIEATAEVVEIAPSERARGAN